MPIIAVSNQKGGVGKTTSTLNLGAALQARGKRVLLVDLDPQGNLSVAAGLLQPETLSPSVGDLLVQAVRPGAAVPNAREAIVRSPRRPGHHPLEQPVVCGRACAGVGHQS